MTAYVIGNGISRNNIDLTKLDGKTYGCNALYKEFKPDVLVATDDPISRHIQASRYALENTFYTRKVYSGTGAKKLRPQYAKWSSGPNAVQLAVYDKHDEIVLLGFDFGSKSKTLNNVYANTEFYQHSYETVSYYGNWLNQIETIIKAADKTEFTIVIGNETCDTAMNLERLENVKIIQVHEFINNVMETNI